VLRENAGLIKLIEVDDPGICSDIDTPDDLRRAR
jgi:CTP:molybdopterin cytidylyltransferase MocA